MTTTSARIAVRVRPRRVLLRTGLVSAVTALATITVAVIVIAGVGGHWRILLAVDLLAVAVCVAAGLRALVLFTSVDDTGISGNGFLAPVLRVPVDRIHSVHLVPTWTHSGEIVTQLLVADAEGRRLFRRRGTYWDAQALEAIAAALPVPTVRRPDPMSIRAFWRAYPRSVYWFEDSPVVRGALGVGAILIGVGLAVGILAVIR